MNYERIIEIVNMLTENHLSGRQIMDAHGLTRNQFYRLKERMHKLGIQIVYNRSSQTYSLNRNRLLSESEADVVARLDRLELTRRQTDKVLKELSREYHPMTGPTVIEFSKMLMKFGVIADEHCGSKFYRPDILRHAAANFKRQKVDFVVNCGDSVEGMSDRDGHIYELALPHGLGATSQAKYMAREFEVFEGLDVYSIEAQGSHGGWAQKRSNQGLEIGPYLEALSGPYKFIGYDAADLVVNGITIRLRHPSKSGLVSYVNGLTGGDKPHMVIDGHFHSKAGYKIHRNVHCFDAGCMQSQTPFLKRLGSLVVLGYWIVEIAIGDAPNHGTQTLLESGKFIESVKAEFVPFYDAGISDKHIREVDQSD